MLKIRFYIPKESVGAACIRFALCGTQYISCKCQYKNVGFLENKSVGFPTSLFSIFLVIFRHILHLIL